MARTAEQNQRMRDERREQILAAALESFGNRGLAATKISDIAEAAGISQGLLYHYFGSKESVFTEIIRDAFSKLNQAARALEASPLPARRKIADALAQLVASLEQDERFSRTILLIAQASTSPATPVEARRIIDAQAEVPYQVIARIMEQGQADGSVVDADPKQLSVLFWTQIKGLALHRASFRNGFRAPPVELLTRLFLRSEA